MLGELLIWLGIMMPLSYLILNLNWRGLLEWIFS
jgi:hypothetical protein